MMRSAVVPFFFFFILSLGEDAGGRGGSYDAYPTMPALQWVPLVKAQ